MALFGPGREGFLAGEIDWDTASIRAVLGRGYSFNAAHRFVSDLSGHTAVATSAPLTGKTITNGVADAADITLTAVPAGAACPYIIIFQSSAVAGGGDVAATAQRLIAFISTATGLPVTPNGADINVAWDNGANRIFML